MSLPLRCRCGSVEGFVASTGRAARAVCYCRDCQSYARFLGKPERTLDAHGGTDIIATVPQFVSFKHGVEKLRCMSLSEKGILRWYAGCCKTPVANLPRDPKLPYVGLVHECIGSPAALDTVVGPVRVRVNTKSAVGAVESTPGATLLAVMKIMTNVGTARLSGKYKETPFFDMATMQPIAEPQVISKEERQRLRDVLQPR